VENVSNHRHRQCKRFNETDDFYCHTIEIWGLRLVSTEGTKNPSTAGVLYPRWIGTDLSHIVGHLPEEEFREAGGGIPCRWEWELSRRRGGIDTVTETRGGEKMTLIYFLWLELRSPDARR